MMKEDQQQQQQQHEAVDSCTVEKDAKAQAALEEEEDTASSSSKPPLLEGDDQDEETRTTSVTSKVIVTAKNKVINEEEERSSPRSTSSKMATTDKDQTVDNKKTAARLTENRSPYWSESSEDEHSVDQDVPTVLSDDDDDGNDDFQDEPGVVTRKRRQLLKRQRLGEDQMALWTDDKHNSTKMTRAQVQIFNQLDLEYERALEEREVHYAARYTSVRQAAFLSVTFMLLYLTLGATFFLREQTEDTQLNDALLFLIYTITTVGYGDVDFPETVRFQLFTIVYIFVGIATLTIMVALCYQWIALEATRAQHARDKQDLQRRTSEMVLLEESEFVPIEGDVLEITQQRTCGQALGECLLGTCTRCKGFFLEHFVGRAISVLFPFVGLIAIGAGVVGPIEGWTFVESVYFAVVSLTTVGFGDYVPTQTASIWFCIFWLPFSIGFMSLFLSNVAHFYIRLSDKNIRRLELHTRRKLQKEKDAMEKERSLARKRALRGQEVRPQDENEDGEPSTFATLSTTNGARQGQRGFFETLPDDDGLEDNLSVGGNTALFGSPESEQSVGHVHRENVLAKSRYRPFDEQQSTTNNSGSTMSTMKDVIETVRENVAADSDTSQWNNGPPASSRFASIMNDSSVSLRRPSVAGERLHKKPSFALRVLVQERLAEIIATDVAGFQNEVEIAEDTLSVTIDSLRDTADKWCLPRKARKAFRAVAFESLYFVGERGLITRGPEALYDLTPFEFHGLFSPLVAAMGDADTMSAWLASTEVLAQVDLKRETTWNNRRSETRSDENHANDVVPTLSYAQRVRMSREEETKRRSGGSTKPKRRSSRTSSSATVGKKKNAPAEKHVLT